MKINEIAILEWFSWGFIVAVLAVVAWGTITILTGG
jgi:hypothetical protein